MKRQDSLFYLLADKIVFSQHDGARLSKTYPRDRPCLSRDQWSRDANRLAGVDENRIVRPSDHYGLPERTQRNYTPCEYHAIDENTS